MGGSCYDRDVFSTTSNRAFSDISDRAFSTSNADESFLPKKKGERKCRDIDCFHRSPIACILDVTGSMGNWSKTIYDKLPLFFGEIEKQGYLPDPAISFAAVGDVYSDRAPLQICNFSQSKELDDFLSRIWLEGGGGGQYFESYELMAYFYLHHCILKKPEQSFMFICGDEGFYKEIDPKMVKEHFGDHIEKCDSRKVIESLRKKFNVFLIHKPYGAGGSDTENKILRQWQEVLGERVLMLSDPKAIIDVMLGAVALTSKSRDLDSYLVDMKKRGQTSKRLNDVEKILENYSSSLALTKVTVKGRLPMPFPMKKAS
ncbi:MAG: hypothetical protein RDV48_00720 [Candidatus Eremiobacteraeota bacterium]|nr:hypothetical protein [Candidatus Eremiobacteraeota bacterium]